MDVTTPHLEINLRAKQGQQNDTPHTTGTLTKNQGQSSYTISTKDDALWNYVAECEKNYCMFPERTQSCLPIKGVRLQTLANKHW